MRLGVAKKPTSEGYVRLMVQGLPDECHVNNFTPLSQKLRANPDLLEDELWRLFEVETHAFSLDQSKNNPHAPANYESWSTAVLKLAADGRIDRERLLDASFSGITAGFKKGGEFPGPGAEPGLSGRLTGWRAGPDKLRRERAQVC